MQIFQNKKWRPPPSWILKNVNSFRKDEAILTKFQWHTPDTNLCRSPGPKVKILRIQDGGRRHLGFWKISKFDPSGRYQLAPGVCC